MLDKGKNAAIQRGVHAARHWKRTRNCVKKWDATCVGWTKSHRFPGWLGHVPIVLVLLLSVASILLGGLLIGLVVGLIWMAIIGLSPGPYQIEQEHDDVPDNHFTPTGYIYDPEPYSIDDEHPRT
jgi:hypothetical protein